MQVPKKKSVVSASTIPFYPNLWGLVFNYFPGLHCSCEMTSLCISQCGSPFIQASTWDSDKAQLWLSEFPLSPLNSPFDDELDWFTTFEFIWWIELEWWSNWIEMNWIRLNWIELNWESVNVRTIVVWYAVVVGGSWYIMDCLFWGGRSIGSLRYGRLYSTEHVWNSEAYITRLGMYGHILGSAPRGAGREAEIWEQCGEMTWYRRGMGWCWEEGRYRWASM